MLSSRRSIVGALNGRYEMEEEMLKTMGEFAELYISR
jgi:hypothetical protein